MTGEDDLSALYTSRGLSGRQRLGSRPALVVVDLILGFTDPTSPLYCDMSVALDATVDLLQSARRAHRPVAFTTVAYDPSARRVAEAFIEKVPSLALLEAGSRWVELDPRLGRTMDEVLFVKLFASAFFGTGLASALVAAGCDSVVLAGASTSGCVRATAVDALQYGYRVIVPSAAVADRAEAAHRASLVDIDAKYGNVVELRDAIEFLASAGDGNAV